MADEKQEKMIKLAQWALPVVFAAGGLYATFHSLTSDVAAVERRVEAHEDLDAHPVSEVKLQELQTVQAAMQVEQREMRLEQKHAAENIAAICQATGARCR